MKNFDRGQILSLAQNPTAAKDFNCETEREYEIALKLSKLNIAGYKLINSEASAKEPLFLYTTWGFVLTGVVIHALAGKQESNSMMFIVTGVVMFAIHLLSNRKLKSKASEAGAEARDLVLELSRTAAQKGHKPEDLQRVIFGYQELNLFDILRVLDIEARMYEPQDFIGNDP